MMTNEEQQKRIESVSRLRRAAFKKWMDKTPDKLFAFNTLFEPPVTIREAVRVQSKRLREESREAYELWKRLDRIVDRLYALPTSVESTCLGKKYSFIHKGMLPDFTPTSEDEAEALKMLEEFYARKTA
ncbi:MAG: hypothetical protein IJK81_13560 [Selenomonadaceae bacterium]|nr:hypothetical protein [Selenomonadaceae bacterium]